MKIGNKTIGPKVYVIAEAGVNHNGSLARAKELIKAASIAGADAIKFQTYTADELVVKGTPKFWDWEGDKHLETQYDAYAKLGGFPYEYYPELIQYCKDWNIEFLSTPFSFEAADKLNALGMRAFKIASSDMSTLPFLEHVAKFGKPILLSTGAATLQEVREAVETIKNAGNKEIILLHCTLKYPTETKDLNLALIQTFKKEFPDCTIGLSDHSQDVWSSVAAVAAGAVVLEKHFTVDKTLPDSADHWLSLDQNEMSKYRSMASLTKDALGSPDKIIFDCEKETRMYDKRSLVSAIPIPMNATVTREMLTFKRPGTGIWPLHTKTIIGKIANQAIPADTTLQWLMFE